MLEYLWTKDQQEFWYDEHFKYAMEVLEIKNDEGCKYCGAYSERSCYCDEIR